MTDNSCTAAAGYGAVGWIALPALSSHCAPARQRCCLGAARLPRPSRTLRHRAGPWKLNRTTTAAFPARAWHTLGPRALRTAQSQAGDSFSHALDCHARVGPAAGLRWAGLARPCRWLSRCGCRACTPSTSPVLSVHCARSLVDAAPSPCIVTEHSGIGTAELARSLDRAAPSARRRLLWHARHATPLALAAHDALARGCQTCWAVTTSWTSRARRSSLDRGSGCSWGAARAACLRARRAPRARKRATLPALMDRHAESHHARRTSRARRSAGPRHSHGLLLWHARQAAVSPEQPSR
jgi:hypothetical protein